MIIKLYGKNSRFVFIAISLIFNSSVLSQNTDDIQLQQKLEDLSESYDIQPDLYDLTEEFQSLKDHPINLNTATAEDLKQLSILSENQIKNILEYRKNYGDFLTNNEIFAVEGFDSITIAKLLPFIRNDPIHSKHSLKLLNLINEGNSLLIMRCQQVLQKQQGYHVSDSLRLIRPNSVYLGSQQHYLFRYTYTYWDRLSAGFSGEKDAGEEFFKGSQPNGMDFYAGFVSLQNTGILKTLTIGNFNADFGQGLTLSSGLSFGSLVSSGNTLRIARGITPSLSMNEFRYLKGIAMTLKIKSFEVSAFYSHHGRDGTILSKNELNKVTAISAFAETGYHRTKGEIATRNVLKETLFGGTVNFRNNFMKIGITGYESQWTAAICPDPSPYNQYDFSGTRNLDLGFDALFLLKGNYIFGEAARSRNGGIAYITGISCSPDSRFSFSLIYRNYQRNYQNLMSNAFGQNSGNANEKGIFISISAKILKDFTFIALADHYIFPWLKYRTDFISRGSEYSVRMNYIPSNKVTMNLSLRIKSKQIDQAAGLEAIPSWICQKSLRASCQLDWQVNSSIILRNRAGYVQNSDEVIGRKSGYFICQDVNYKASKAHLIVSFRYALFETDSYNERIYVYENDIAGSASVPAFGGTGIRCCLTASWSPVRKLEIWLRYGQTYYPGVQTIGIGPEEINGDLKSEIKAELVYKL